MAAAEALEQRWGFLAPWCEILKRNGYLYYKMNDSPGDVWSGCRRSIHITPLGSIAAVREALAILAAVESVEYAGWRFLLEKHCGLNLGQQGEEKYEEQIPVKFVLVPRIYDDDDDMFDSDLVHLCGVRQREHTTNYEVALTQIAALDERLRPDQAGVNIEIPVSVAYDLIIENDSLQQHITMAKAERIIRAEWKGYTSRNQEVVPGTLRCTFVLKPIPAVFGDLEIMTDVMQVVDIFSVNNVWFPKVWLDLRRRLDASNVSHWKLFGRLMALIFQSWSPMNVLLDSDFSSLGKSEFGLAVNKIRTIYLEGAEILMLNTMSPCYTEAMFSALIQNQALKKLAFRFQTELPTGEFWWGWMAYALFSNRARALSCTKYLALLKITSMSTADMDAFSRVLTSEHPEEDLFGCPRGKVDERDATFRVGAKIDRQPHGVHDAVEGANVLRFESPVRSVRIFSDDGESEWVNGLVPGLGRCRIRRVDLTFDQPVVASSASKLTSLRIGFDRCHPSRPPNSEGLPRFLGMIGASLKYLTLEAGVGGLDKISVLESCPQLHELTLVGGCIDAQLRFDEYHAKRLGEPFPVLTYDWYNVTAIATLLADPDSLLTKCVRRLRVYMSVRWNQELSTWEVVDDLHRFEADCNALLTMLSLNRRLEYLEVVVPSNIYGDAKSLRVHHDEPIDRVLNPLPLACRLAFLSVLSADSPRVQPDAKRARVAPSCMGRGHLNHDVLANIFSLAALPVHREVFTRKSFRAKSEMMYNESLPW